MFVISVPNTARIGAVPVELMALETITYTIYSTKNGGFKTLGKIQLKGFSRFQ